jgi:thiol:disulfide interchange protein DsbC
MQVLLTRLSRWRNLGHLSRQFALASACALGAWLAASPAWAQDSAVEAAIRKGIHDNQPQWPAIDEIRKTPIAGLYELRVDGTQIFYTDEQGRFLIQEGQLLDLKQKRNLTEERLNKLMALSFDTLPVKDSFTVVHGNGKRQLAIFSDPNCGYCKRMERDFAKMDNITIHVFLYPVLSPSSIDKSKLIWCAKDRSQAWQDMMLHDQLPKGADCDVSAIQRNLAFGHKHQIQGTPTMFLADGKRVPGAMEGAQLEQLMNSATR